MGSRRKKKDSPVEGKKDENEGKEHGSSGLAPFAFVPSTLVSRLDTIYTQSTRDKPECFEGLSFET